MNDEWRYPVFHEVQLGEPLRVCVIATRTGSLSQNIADLPFVPYTWLPVAGHRGWCVDHLAHTHNRRSSCTGHSTNLSFHQHARDTLTPLSCASASGEVFLQLVVPGCVVPGDPWSGDNCLYSHHSKTLHTVHTWYLQEYFCPHRADNAQQCFCSLRTCPQWSPLPGSWADSSHRSHPEICSVCTQDNWLPTNSVWFAWNKKIHNWVYRRSCLVLSWQRLLNQSHSANSTCQYLGWSLRILIQLWLGCPHWEPEDSALEPGCSLHTPNTANVNKAEELDLCTNACTPGISALLPFSKSTALRRWPFLHPHTT